VFLVCTREKERGFQGTNRGNNYRESKCEQRGGVRGSDRRTGGGEKRRKDQLISTHGMKGATNKKTEE